MLTEEDLKDAWPNGLPCIWPVSEDIKMPPHLPLSIDKVRYVGDGVAVVVAESRAQAKDAIELIEVDYEPLPAVTDVEKALEPGAPLVHEDVPENRCYAWSLEGGEPDKVFAEAAHTVQGRYRQQRLIPVLMEPRGVVCEVSPATGDVTVVTSTQAPHIMRTAYTLVLGIPEAKTRVIAPMSAAGSAQDGRVRRGHARHHLRPETRRSVKWIEERSEACLATVTAATSSRIEASPRTRAGRSRASGCISGRDGRLPPGGHAGTRCSAPGSTQVATRPSLRLPLLGVFTNTTPTDAYRGAGRPEATYAIERTMDKLAAAVEQGSGRDPSHELHQEVPATIASGLEIDSGDYEASLDKDLKLLDYEGLRAEQAARRERGDTKQLGVGFSTYVEMWASRPPASSARSSSEAAAGRR